MPSNWNDEYRKLQYGSMGNIFKRFNDLQAKYGDLTPQQLYSAFAMSNGIGGMYTNNPYTQNTRVKGISTLPNGYDKNKVAEFLRKPNESETQLRQVEHALEWTAYPLFHTRKTYQSLMTYHNYIAPCIIEDGDTKKKEFWREYKLLERLRIKSDMKSFGHKIVGQVGQEGKVFYTYRMKVDKPHNKVDHIFFQQLPSDYVKIVGFNNVSKYTLMFDMMYFCQPGTTPLQFGDLFKPYLTDFYTITDLPDKPKGLGKKVVFGQRHINLDKLREMEARPDIPQFGDGKPDVYYQNGKWYYWVTLPVDKAFTFEADDATHLVAPPFAGLFIDMIQLAQYEQLQLQLLQNPLISVLTGEIPYFDIKDSNLEDQYMLSNSGRLLFTALWYQMMQENNTSGVGLYAAPFKNMKLESLAEAPSAMDIVQQGYSDTMSKAGLSAIIPVTEDARAGMAQISLEIECRFMEPVYDCIERMMDAIIDSLNLKYEFRFHMFGNIAQDKTMDGELRTAMTLGIASATIRYNALHDLSIFEDISWSDAIFDSYLYERRYPLFTSYTAKSPAANYPPHTFGQDGLPIAYGKDGQQLGEAQPGRPQKGQMGSGNGVGGSGGNRTTNPGSNQNGNWHNWWDDSEDHWDD